MKTKLTLALAAAITSTAFGTMPAHMPEFKNEKQLAEWRAEMAAKPATKSTADDHAFYTGKPYVDASGGYAFKFRSYNPELARWTSEDPSGFPDGANNHLYSNQPLTGFDPDGRSWWNPIDWVNMGERQIWEAVATYYMVPNGLTISADLLRHSLQDSPTDLTDYKLPISAIKSSSEFTGFRDGLPTGNVTTGPKDLTFGSGDLYAAMRNVTITANGSKQSNTNYNINFTVTDSYDFHITDIGFNSPQQMLATIGANVAYADQLMGSINAFNISVSFE